MALNPNHQLEKCYTIALYGKAEWRIYKTGYLWLRPLIRLVLRLNVDLSEWFNHAAKLKITRRL
jgi:hypothetical protein